jgi:serine/threonine protein kinase
MSTISVPQCVLLEPYQGGELSFHLLKFGKLTESVARAFFVQLVEALVYFTAQTGCCHRDLKPWNICLSDDLTQIKLIDFG